MPSERFFKLSDDKKKRIIDAAFREFASSPMEDISINRIVRDAGISRGSFYTYFESKTDVLGYLVKEQHRHIYELVDTLIEQYNGDFFAMTECFAGLACERAVEFSRLLQKSHTAISSGFSSTESLLSFAGMIGRGTSMIDDKLWERIDRSRLNIGTRGEMHALSVECRSIIMLVMVKTMMFPETKQENLELFSEMLKIIKRGVLK